MIICDGTARPAVVAARLTSVLGRYPGCAVAAASADAGTCMIAARFGTVVSLAICGPADDPRLRALACGSLVHAWLCAGRELAGLDPLSLRVVTRRTPATRGGLVQGGAWSCSLRDAGGSASDW
jgi:hypothetical protein